ncbi:hypothetical protein [Nonomuraea angiospora]
MENPANLHVVGRTADGRIWHTIRSPTAWTPFGNVLAAAGRLDLEGLGAVVDIAAARCAGVGLNGHPEGLYVLLALNSGPPVLLFRSADTGQWSQEAGGYFSRARRVAAAVSFIVSQGAGAARSELHLAVTTDDGYLMTAIHQHGSSSPDVPVDVEWSAGDRGEHRAVALLGQGAIDAAHTTARLLTATADGRMYVTTGAPGAWEPFTDVESAGAGERGDFVDVAIASGSSQTDYFGVTGDGRVWLASENNSATWQQWRDLEEINKVVGGGPWTWKTTEIADVGTFVRVAAATTSEGEHVLGVTSNGHLFHQLRASAPGQFRDVEAVGVGQDVGSFTAVACA